MELTTAFEQNYAPIVTRKRKHVKSGTKFSSVHAECDNCFREGPRLKKKAKKSLKSRKGSYSGYFSRMIRRFIELSFALSMAGAWNLQYAVWVKVPRRETFLKFPKLCKRTMGSTARLVSHHSRYFLKNRTPEFGGWYRHQTLSTGSKFNSQNSNGSGRFRQYPLIAYFRSLKWTPIPLSLGFAVIAYQHYRRKLRRENPQLNQPTSEESVANDWEITSYRVLPWNSLSKAWGWVNSIDLPLWAREPVLKWYATAFGCDMEEAEVSELMEYKNLGELFRRSLKTGARPIDADSAIVSPADGMVLHFGKAACGVIEQVKGVCYSLPVFLGPSTWTYPAPNESKSVQSICQPRLTRDQFASQILHNKSGTNLFYSVIYLAPGDYHRFHSPVNWEVQFRRHFAGELLSVSPSIAHWIGGLFSLNERAVYVGKWEHGFFSMIAVGATNVGSIRINGDEELHTNSRRVKKNTFEDRHFPKPLCFQKGEPFGEFNLGSTIVLVFEAPSDFEYKMNPGCRVRVGQGIFQESSKPKEVATQN